MQMKSLGCKGFQSFHWLASSRWAGRKGKMAKSVSRLARAKGGRVGMVGGGAGRLEDKQEPSKAYRRSLWRLP